MHNDPNVISVARAARLARRDRMTFSRMLRDDPGFAQAVSTNLPGSRITISYPKLMRHLHGDHWKQDVAS